jgi:hypothetical protein
VKTNAWDKPKGLYVTGVGWIGEQTNSELFMKYHKKHTEIEYLRTDLKVK